MPPSTVPGTTLRFAWQAFFECTRTHRSKANRWACIAAIQKYPTESFSESQVIATKPKIPKHRKHSPPIPPFLENILHIFQLELQRSPTKIWKSKQFLSQAIQISLSRYSKWIRTFPTTSMGFHRFTINTLWDSPTSLRRCSISCRCCWPLSRSWWYSRASKHLDLTKL